MSTVTRSTCATGGDTSHPHQERPPGCCRGGVWVSRWRLVLVG